MLIEGHIKEIRTSADGDYDDACNCWAANEFIIVTDLYIYLFVAEYNNNENNNYWWVISKITDYDKKDFPFKLKAFTEESFVFDKYSKDNGIFLEDLQIKYEDIFLWISSMHPGYSLFSLQGGDSMSGNIVMAEDSKKSKYIAWDDFADFYLIEFEKDEK